MTNSKTWLIQRPEISKNQIEKSANIPQGYLSKWLKGHRELPAKHIISLNKFIEEYESR